jgi:hypothetical protein
MQDDDGNWPMVMTVRGLPPVAKPFGRYELFLTRDGKRAASCGYFTITDEVTEVFLNAPYRFRTYDGWAVARAGTPTRILLQTEVI